MKVNVTPEMISEFGAALRPGQVIGQDKIMAKLSWKLHRFYATKREMQSRGMITEEIRQGAPTLYTFHNPPLEAKDRQRTPTKHRPNGAAKTLFATKVVRTFEVQAGNYTPEELRPLALAVLKALKETP